MGFLAVRRGWCGENGADCDANAGFSRIRRARCLACRLVLAAGVLLPGCWGDPGAPKAQTPQFRGITLKVGAVDDRAIMTGVSVLRGEWEASRGGQIEMVGDLVAPTAPLAA